jgi:hypothetical protein
MQEKNNNIQPFDSILSAYINKADKDLSTSSQLDKEFELVFSGDYAQQLSDEKANLLIDKAYSELSKDTLGTVITTGILTHHIEDKALISETGLSISLLDDIKHDRIFSNSIPVRSLMRLIKLLGINLSNALEAIDRTFDRLITENQLQLSLPVKAQPAFRKSSTTRNDYGFDVHRYKSDEGYLFQNREALEKYKKRLEELYNEE